VSDRRVLAAIFRHLGVEEASLGPVYEVVDKLEREPRERLERRLADLGFDAQTISGIIDVTELRGISDLDAAYGDVPAVVERVAELSSYLGYLDDLGVADFVDVDLSVVRGLAYYTGIVFELWDARRELRAICGGGRYDDLLQVIAGIDLPALGFGMGDVVLAELLQDHGLLPKMPSSVDCFVAWLGPEGRTQALRTVQALRSAGLSAVFEYRDRRLGNQLKGADQLGARWAVIIGPQEVEAGQARIRDMSTGDERLEAFDRLVESMETATSEP
jgi:histidyl-tRNA synthetase